MCFNDCILGKSDQIVNPVIAKVNSVLYLFMFVNLLITNVGKPLIHNYNRYSELKSILRRGGSRIFRMVGL